MEGRQEGILDDTQELTTENMPENQPGASSEKAEKQKITKTGKEAAEKSEKSRKTKETG